jgi:hypothetical protein
MFRGAGAGAVVVVVEVVVVVVVVVAAGGAGVGATPGAGGGGAVVVVVVVTMSVSGSAAPTEGADTFEASTVAATSSTGIRLRRERSDGAWSAGGIVDRSAGPRCIGTVGRGLERQPSRQ